MERIFNMYKEYGMQRVKGIALNHAEIEVEVRFARERVIEHLETKYDNIDTLVLKCKDLMGDAESRSRESMIIYIAALEYQASFLRDEVADGAYSYETERQKDEVMDKERLEENDDWCKDDMDNKGETKESTWDINRG